MQGWSGRSGLDGRAGGIYIPRRSVRARECPSRRRMERLWGFFGRFVGIGLRMRSFAVGF